MIILQNTTDSLQFKLSGSISTNQLSFVCYYVDSTSTAYSPLRTTGLSNNTSIVTLASAPASSTTRTIKTLSIQNKDTASATVTIQFNDNGTLYNIIVATLSTGDNLEYTESNGWKVLNSSGEIKTGSAGGSITPAALTKVDDTNVTLTLGGTPTSALLQAVSLSLGWTGTLADARIASAATWNAKQAPFTILSTLGVLADASGVLTNNGAGVLSWGTVSSADFVLISTQTASSSATIDFTGLTSTYSSYKVVVSGVYPATNNAVLWMRIGTGGTPTYQSGASDYAYTSSVIPYAQIGGASGSVGGYASVADTKIVLSNPIKNAVLRPYNAEIKFYDPAQSASYHNIRAEACAWDSDTYLEGFFLNASYLSATSITAIRFLMSTGNIAGGTFKLYGIK